MIDNGVNYHILGYGIDLNNKEFYKFIKENQSRLEEVNMKIIEKIENDHQAISLEDYLNFTYDRRKGGWKVLHYFIQIGLTETLDEGFMLYAEYEHSYNCVQFLSIKVAC